MVERVVGRRVVYALYDKCTEIWSGCPAAESTVEGIETAEVSLVENVSLDESEETSSLLSTAGSPATGKEQVEPSEPTLGNEFEKENYTSIEPLRKNIKQQKEDLSNILKDRRNAKSTKKAAFQEQMTNLTKEDVQIKRKTLK